MMIIIAKCTARYIWHMAAQLLFDHISKVKHGARGKLEPIIHTIIDGAQIINSCNTHIDTRYT